MEVDRYVSTIQFLYNKVMPQKKNAGNHYQNID